MTSCTTFDPQSNFNWGYHDGATDFKHGRANKWQNQEHPNKEYKAGYVAGYRDAEEHRYYEDSSTAWELALLYEIV